MIINTPNVSFLGIRKEHHFQPPMGLSHSIFFQKRHLFDSEIAQMDRRSHPHHGMIKFCSIAIGHNLRWFPGERWKEFFPWEHCAFIVLVFLCFPGELKIKNNVQQHFLLTYHFLFEMLFRLLSVVGKPVTKIEKANINPSKNIIDTEGTNEEENMHVGLLGLE